MPSRLYRVGALVAVALAVPETSGADAAEYAVRVEAPPLIKEGASGAVSVTLVPSAGRRLSKKGPMRIAVAIAPEKGLGLSKRLFRRRDAVDPEADALRFNFAATAEAKGKYEIDLEIRFWVCGKRTCRPVREQRRVEISVSN